MDNVTQNIKFNVAEEDQLPTVNEPVTISKLSVTFENDEHRDEETDGKQQRDRANRHIY